MARFALVADGRVVNIAEADAEWVAASGFTGVELQPEAVVGVGWLWDGSAFTRPPEPPPTVPTEVTMRQARLALRRTGKYGQIQAALNKLPEPDRTEAQIEWEYSSTLQRSHHLVATLGGALGLDDAALDVLFVQAATL